MFISRYVFCFLLMAILYNSSCKTDKETFISGHITNIKDGKPLNKFPVSILGYKKPTDLQYILYTSTDSLGYYEFTPPSNSDSDVLGTFDGQCYRFFSISGNQKINKGKINTCDLQAEMVDGFIAFVMQNSSGVKDVNLNFRVLCGLKSTVYSCCNESMSLNSIIGQTDTVLVRISAGREVFYSWDTLPINTSNAGKYGGIYCPVGEKTHVKIEY
jgi:hypothetical protein